MGGCGCRQLYPVEGETMRYQIVFFLLRAPSPLFPSPSSDVLLFRHGIDSFEGKYSTPPNPLDEFFTDMTRRQPRNIYIYIYIILTGFAML